MTVNCTVFGKLSRCQTCNKVIFVGIKAPTFSFCNSGRQLLNLFAAETAFAFRSCTLLIGSAIILLLLAFFFALTGHCNADNKTLIACGLYILGGKLRLFLLCGSVRLIYLTVIVRQAGWMRAKIPELDTMGKRGCWPYSLIRFLDVLISPGDLICCCRCAGKSFVTKYTIVLLTASSNT